MEDSERLSRARRAVGLTQAELAGRSGVPQPMISAYERGARKPSVEVFTALMTAIGRLPREAVRTRAARVRELVAQYRGSNPRIFGSVARGDDDPLSDVDLLIRLNADFRFTDLFALRAELENELGVPVDVVGDGGLGDRHDHVREEAVPV